MKKLMIAAAAAAMVGGAYANDCNPGETPQTSCAMVYSVKMTVKTTKGVAMAGVAGKDTQCAPGAAGTCYVIRTKDSTKFEGWIYECACNCETIATGSQVFWDSKRKVQLDDAALTTTFINVMGKKATEAEWAWTFAGTAKYDEERSQAYALMGAGYGKYTSKGYFTSFSGNFAGMAGQSYDLTTFISKNACACDPSMIWKCENLTELVASDTIAFGTWTAKYDSSASKKFLSNGYLKVPSYVTYTLD